MKATMIAVSFIAFSSAASADVFAPWDNRDAIKDAPAAVQPADDVTSAYFAPWDQRDVAADVNDRDAMAIDAPVSAFRPWS